MQVAERVGGITRNVVWHIFLHIFFLKPAGDLCDTRFLDMLISHVGIGVVKEI